MRIHLPRPRELDVKRSPEFVSYADQIWKLLASQRVTVSSLRDEV
jgi:hypothetical protein